MTLLDLVVTDTSWITICRLDDLGAERGAAALVHGRQVALFRLMDDTVHAIQQHDPYSGAYVMSRGLVGSRGDVPTVTSPMYKQVFDLRTGACLDAVGKQEIDLRIYPVQVIDGLVQILAGVAMDADDQEAAATTMTVGSGSAA